MESIRILLANDHPIIRNSLRAVLAREARFRVVGEAANEREVITLVLYTHPDVVLLDIKAPAFHGIRNARQLTAEDPKPKIVFVSALSDESYVSEAFRAGARGYVLEDSAVEDLIPAINAAINGRAFLSPAIGAQIAERHGDKTSFDSALRGIGIPEAIVAAMAGC